MEQTDKQGKKDIIHLKRTRSLVDRLRTWEKVAMNNVIKTT